MLSNFGLEKLSEKYGFALDSVIMKDKLKTLKPPKNGNYIINLESSTQGNETHWLCLAVRGKQCFYCDSFGVLSPQEVISFCKKIPKSHLAYSEFQIQNIKAETCVFFARGMLIYVRNNPNKDLYLACSDYIHMFKYDTAKNNSILKAFYRSLPQSKGFKLVNKLYSQK